MTDILKSEEIIDAEQDNDDEDIFENDDVLGKYISHHPVNRLRLLLQAGLIYFVITTALQLLFAELDDQTASILLIFFFAAIALGLSWYVMHLWNREVVIYEQGFNFREGSSIADFKYNEVVSFRQKAERMNYFGGLFRRNIYEFTVRTHRDELMKVTNLYTDIEKLGNNLEVGINSVLRDKVRQSLIAGESVSFGDALEVSQDGMVADERSLSWDEFKGYRTQQGHLTLLSNSDDIWYKIPLGQVDNLTLLVEALHQQLPKPTQET